MTHYFCSLSFRLLLSKLKGINVRLFKSNTSVPLFIPVLRKIPPIKTKLDNIAQEPDVHIGDYKGLNYRLNNEALECTDFIYEKLGLEDCHFIKIYNERFKTNKLKPFVLKWISMYVFELLICLYRIHLDSPSLKLLYLDDNSLNRHIYEWWYWKTGDIIQIQWLKQSDLRIGLATLALSALTFVFRPFFRGLCLPAKPKKFKIMKEATWGLQNPVFRDDFFIDGEKLLKQDLLLYTYGSRHEGRTFAYKDAQNSGYQCINRTNLKIPLNLLCQRLFKYHFLLPVVLILKNIKNKRNYLLREWLTAFHGAAVNYEILLSHYQIGLDLSVNEASLSHIPETILLNNYGAKSVIFHWSDLLTYYHSDDDLKSFNVYLIWGKAHSHGKRYFVDSMVETGCWLKHNFGEFTRNKKRIYENLGLPVNSPKVLLAFYDTTIDPDFHFTEDVLLDFWQLMFEIVDGNKNVIGIMKPKVADRVKHLKLSDKGDEIYNKIRQRCLENGRVYFIDNPSEFAVTEVIAISDINITMGMGSPSTIALLCGKIGLYYDTTGSDYHPFTRRYRKKLVFDNKGDLFSVVRNITDGAYNPLPEIDEELLRGFDQFRDDKGLERFKQALLDNL